MIISEMKSTERDKALIGLAKNILRVRYELSDDFDFTNQPTSWDCEIKDVISGIMVGNDLASRHIKELEDALKECYENPDRAKEISMKALGLS